MSATERITINNILAFMIIFSYVAMWSFTVYTGLVTVVPEGDTRTAVLIDSLDTMREVLITMTIIVVLVVQFYFRTSPAKSPPESKPVV